MREYSDRVSYVEDNSELAYRDGNYEFNRSVVRVSAVRKFSNGQWFITSCQGCNADELMKLIELLPKSGGDVELLDTELYVGSVSLGKGVKEPTELLRVASEVCRELRSSNVVRCEFILNIREYSKVIERDVGEARERKVLAEIIVGVVSRGLRYGYGGVHNVLIATPENVNTALVDKLVRDAYRKSLISCRSKSLNPVEVGRQVLILKPEVTAALIHEISHLLEATSPNKLLLNSKICNADVNIYDNPHEVTSPTIRLFDDEGVPTSRRSLVEGCVVVDYHHIRLTAKEFGSKAGSAYGLYHPPIPFHTTLVMKEGDWRDDEIISDSKKGFIVDGVVMAETEGSYIRIVPEYAVYVERGEPKDYVRVSSVKIPFKNLTTLSAISRSKNLRVSYEKNYIVAEIAPTVRLEGYIE